MCLKSDGGAGLLFYAFRSVFKCSAASNKCGENYKKSGIFSIVCPGLSQYNSI